MKAHKNCGTPTGAFTLIELLVVIAMFDIGSVCFRRNGTRILVLEHFFASPGASPA